MPFKVNFSYAGDFAKDECIASLAGEVAEAHNKIHNGTGLGSGFLGWVDLPVNYDKEEFERIKKAAQKIRVVIIN